MTNSIQGLKPVGGETKIIIVLGRFTFLMTDPITGKVIYHIRFGNVKKGVLLLWKGEKVRGKDVQA